MFGEVSHSVALMATYIASVTALAFLNVSNNTHILQEFFSFKDDKDDTERRGTNLLINNQDSEDDLLMLLTIFRDLRLPDLDIFSTGFCTGDASDTLIVEEWCVVAERSPGRLNDGDCGLLLDVLKLQRFFKLDVSSVSSS
ncbi:hypothetical protein L2E82_14772 [Cichorium intybus]|uniref:Uncharacterized protein n=1 Tax=Cichorium intybus TaxID=13427 RepID=A0ACB9F232_CICIN|nr:hypothetical protein L2E82_14772 [Cichorium intybus]